MKIVAGSVICLLLTPFSFRAMAQDVLRVGGFNRDAVSLVGEGKGFFKDEEIRPEFSQVRASVELMRNFVHEKYDVIHTTADNVIAWAEGQGADPQPNDFIIFIGGSKSVRLDLIVAPTVSRFADLKGKVLAVDAANTGYAPVLVYLLEKNGLTLNQDYTLKAIGGGEARAEAMKRGEASGAFVSLDDDLKRRGFRKLAQTQDYVPVYALGVGAARRAWASRNEALLVRYIRALVRSTDWLLDPKNKEEAIRIFLGPNQNSIPRAERIYQQSVDPRFGLIPGGQISREGIQVILQLREVMGAMKQPLPLPDKYVDERYYRKAIASLGQ